MSMHVSVISIQGDHLAAVPAIFECMDYKIRDEPKLVSQSEVDAEYSFLAEIVGIVKKVAYYANGWTYIIDFESVMILESSLWETLSARWNTRVFGYICEGASCTYAFWLFDKGTMVRALFSYEGVVSENTGELLPEEAGIDWSAAFETDIFALAKRLGAPFPSDWNDQAYYLYMLDESSDSQ